MKSGFFCDICPRKCPLPKGEGFCAIKPGLFVNKFMVHKWEEPIISGKNGCGAIFFEGCNLRCCYCQNQVISRSCGNNFYDSKTFVNYALNLVEKGVHSLNLVSPSMYIPYLIEPLTQIKEQCDIPIVYNTSGYDDVDWLKKLEGLIDVYLPDFKYFDSALAKNYSNAPDYPIIATKAIKEMLRQQPKTAIKEGLIKKGVIIRHLCLPSHKDDSIAILDYIKHNFPSALLSLMSQYTPTFNTSTHKCLNRRITKYEYNMVLNHAISLGLAGFMQDKSSATKIFTPDFD